MTADTSVANYRLGPLCSRLSFAGQFFKVIRPALDDQTNRSPSFADRSVRLVGKPDNFAPRAAKVPLQGLNPLGRSVKMPLKKSLEDVHESICQVDGLPTKIPPDDSFKEHQAACLLIR